MSRDIHIAPRARADIRRVLKRLVPRSPRGASSWYRALWSAAEQAAADPMRFALIEEAVTFPQEVHEVIFKTRRGRPYRLVYVHSETEVIIVRIRCPGQRPLRTSDLSTE